MNMYVCVCTYTVNMARRKEAHLLFGETHRQEALLDLRARAKSAQAAATATPRKTHDALGQRGEHFITASYHDGPQRLRKHTSCLASF